MRKELLVWFAREGLVLTSASIAADDPEHDEVKISVKAPMLALTRASHDFRICPDPVLFGYPESCLNMITLTHIHLFVLQFLEYSPHATAAPSSTSYPSPSTSNSFTSN